MRTKVTKQGIVWRHEVQLLEAFSDKEPRWALGLPVYTVRVGHDDLDTLSHWGEPLPPLGTLASVDVWVDTPDEPNDASGIPRL